MREREIFIESLQKQTQAESIAYLDDACAGDQALRGRVEQLLAQHRREEKFILDTSPPGIDSTLAQPLAERPGALIGRYKLLEQIGEGGFGVVFLAEQTHPLRRKVALKILKPGMDTRQVIARFEAERQALAIMDHPNIAKVLDGGATDTGRPYFVMELIKGVPITDFCDENHLTPRQRLELFVSVCEAVQHAHQKGIIHRDLKPSNVLVSMHDTKPAVKVIDFGIAKAMGLDLTEKTLFTNFAQMIGTPLYMSPEQAGQNALDVDTRSDIFSLGVLLYELLTGTTPFDQVRFKRAAFDEIRRIIREEEPPRPSTRLSDLGRSGVEFEGTEGTSNAARRARPASSLASVSALRHIEPAKLTKLVRGELDWIVMKALEKDRSRRYDTANGFAMDVQRYLADEPVLACPPSASYRLRKFVRRNKGGLGVAALVLVFLVVLGSGIGWAVRDRAARAADRTSHLERALERAEFLHREGKRGETLAALERAQLLARESEPGASVAGRITSLQQALDAEGRDAAFAAGFDALRRDVTTELDLKTETFSADLAYPMILKALEQYGGITPGATSPDAAVAYIHQRPPAIQTVIVAALNECILHSPVNSDSRFWMLDVLEKADGDPWRNKVRRAWLQPATLETLAKDIDVRQQPPSILILLARNLPIESSSRWDLVRRVQFAYPGDFWANHQLAWDLRQSGQSVEAVRYYTAALALSPDNAGVLLNRANALSDAGELEAAVADLRRAIVVSPRYATAHDNLGIALHRQKKLGEAIDECRKAIELDPKSPHVFNSLGVLLADQGNLDDAIAAYREAIKLDPGDCDVYANLGIALLKQNKLPETVDALRKAIELGGRSASIYSDLCVALCDQKKMDEAAGAGRRAIDLDPKYAIAHCNLGRALRGQKKLDEAIAAFRRAIELDPKLANAHVNLGALLCDELKDYDKAIECFRKAIELDSKNVDASRNLGVALEGLARRLTNGVDEKLRDPRRGLEAAQEAVKVAPQSALAWQVLGWSHYRMGSWNAAIEALEKSCDLDHGPKGGDAAQWFFLAMAHWQLGEKDTAREWYSRAVQWTDKNHPKNEELRRFQAEAAELLKIQEKKLDGE